MMNLKLFNLILCNYVISTKIGKIISLLLIFISILTISFTGKFKLIFVLLSMGCNFLNVVMSKLCVSGSLNEQSIVLSSFLISSLISLICSIFIEKSNIDCYILRTILSGILINVPDFLTNVKRIKLKKGIKISYTFYPYILGMLINFCILKDKNIPLSLMFSVLLTYTSGNFILLRFKNDIFVKPFTTTKSTKYFFSTILIICIGFYQYALSIKSNQIWRINDSLYFILLLKWTLFEIIDNLNKNSKNRFTYGYGRIIYVISFSICLFSLFSQLMILRNIFSSKNIYKNIKFSYDFPIIFCHIYIIFFFLSFPRNKKLNESVINSINFNTKKQKANKTTNKSNESIMDIISFLLSILGHFTQNSFFEKIITLLMSIFIIFLVIPIIKESISILLESTPSSILSKLSDIRNELSKCQCVLEIKYFNIWQYDNSLVIGTMCVKIDTNLCSNTQEFLMYIISLCQHAGILDVTIEIIDQNLEIVANQQLSYYRLQA